MSHVAVILIRRGGSLVSNWKLFSSLICSRNIHPSQRLPTTTFLLGFICAHVSRIQLQSLLSARKGDLNVCFSVDFHSSDTLLPFSMVTNLGRNPVSFLFECGRGFFVARVVELCSSGPLGSVSFNFSL